MRDVRQNNYVELEWRKKSSGMVFLSSVSKSINYAYFVNFLKLNEVKLILDIINAWNA